MWRSGSASPCQGEGRGFEYRHPLGVGLAGPIRRWVGREARQRTANPYRRVRIPHHPRNHLACGLGDWRSGSALPRHGRGRWFDPSIAHPSETVRFAHRQMTDRFEGDTTTIKGPTMFRKKSKYDVAREQLEETLHELISQGFEQGDQLRQTIAERAPEVRDRLAEEVPEMVDKLPAPVADYLPESAKSKPKRKRSRVKKLLFVGLVIGGAAAAAAVLSNRNSGGSYEFDAP